MENKKEENGRIKKLANRIYKTVYTNTSYSHMSGHNKHFDKFLTIARELDKEMK